MSIENQPEYRAAVIQMRADELDHLYVIEDSTVEGEIDPELYRGISMLRQLINECYLHESKTVGNQFLYDHIKPLIKAEASRREERLVDELEAAYENQNDYSEVVESFIRAKRNEIREKK